MVSCLCKYQLSQMDPRDALPHMQRALHTEVDAEHDKLAVGLSTVVSNVSSVRPTMI